MPVANFADALPYLLQNEGGFSDDPKDHGGRTDHGITQHTLDVFRSEHPDLALPEDVADLTEDESGVIYHTDYWMFDGIQSQRVATKLLDMSANMGLRRAVKILQAAVMAESGGLQLVLDGLLGPRTEQAANSCDEAALLHELAVKSVEYYEAIVSREPDQARFLTGWLRRAQKVPA